LTGTKIVKRDRIMHYSYREQIVWFV
jgi:hypothetical protein